MDTDINEEFRHIRLDDGPRLRPLGLDKMFTRVEKWGLAHPSPSPSTSQPTRPASPPRRRGIYPLPRPQEGISPLGGLFDYPELLPLVLSHFDHPRDLAVLARVCSSWCKIARRRLYESVWVRPCTSSLMTVLMEKGRMDVIPSWYHSLIPYIGILDYVDWFVNSVSQVLQNDLMPNDRCPILSSVYSR
jgi:hypothetical protein